MIDDNKTDMNHEQPCSLRQNWVSMQYDGQSPARNIHGSEANTDLT